MISNGIYDQTWDVLIETFYGSQHFDITASGCHEVDNYSRARVIVRGNGGGNTKNGDKNMKNYSHATYRWAYSSTAFGKSTDRNIQKEYDENIGSVIP